MTEFARAAALTIIAGAWLAERMNAYLSATHRAPTGRPRLCWPSRKNGGGYRPTGRRYAVPLDWSRPLATGAAARPLTPQSD